MAGVLALLASLGFAINAICVRRGSLSVEPTLGARITVLVALPIFVVAALAVGELHDLFALPWQAYVMFGLGGVGHFVVGRPLLYLAIRDIGAARSTVVVTISPLITAIIAVPLFDESVSWMLALGGALVILGPILMTQAEVKAPPAVPGGVVAMAAPMSEHWWRGVLFAVGAALVWAVTPVFVKAGLNQADLPVAGALISYCAASLVIISMSARSGRGHELVRADRWGVLWFAFGGLVVGLAQAIRYLAISEGGVTLVALVLQSSPLFVFLLTILVNRRIETLGGAVLAGGILVVVGTAIIVTGGAS